MAFQFVVQVADPEDGAEVFAVKDDEAEARTIAKRLGELKGYRFDVVPIVKDQCDFLLDLTAPLRWRVWFTFNEYYPEDRSTFRVSYLGPANTDETEVVSRFGARDNISGPPQCLHVSAVTGEQAIAKVRDEVIDEWITWWVTRMDELRDKYSVKGD